MASALRMRQLTILSMMALEAEGVVEGHTHGRGQIAVVKELGLTSGTKVVVTGVAGEGITVTTEEISFTNGAVPVTDLVVKTILEPADSDVVLPDE